MTKTSHLKRWTGVIAGLIVASIAASSCSSGRDDGSTSGKDAGSSKDAGQANDAGEVTPDAGEMTPDAGSNEEDAGTSPDAGTPQDCIEVTAGAFQVRDSDGTAGAYSADVMPDTGDSSDADQFSLEFYGSAFDPSFDGENTGTFDLTENGDDNYSTCSRCLLTIQDPNSDSGKVFFPASGTMVIDAASDQLNGTAKATLTDVTLVEVTIDSTTYASTPVAGGTCLHLNSATVDVVTTPPPPPPAGWTCDAEFWSDGDCDCGCGAVDVDCADATADSCDYCDDDGSCSTAECPGTINPTDNSTCSP